MRKLIETIHGDCEYDNDWERPVVVIELGESGDLYQLASFDANDEDALAIITEYLPERIIDGLRERG